jgi:endonuclease/exonuclease/phosphatase family metal-dependent hydrolase
MNPTHFRQLLCVLTLGTVLLGAGASNAKSQNNDQGAAGVMTYNLDEGTDYNEVINALLNDPPQFPAAVQLTIDNVRATNPPARMAALAQQIAAKQPSLVGVQEATQWRTSGTCDDSVTPEFDLLQSLLSQLSALGKHYAAMAVTKEVDLMGPTPSGGCVRATNRDAILARTDLARGEFRVSNIQTANFQNVLSFDSALGLITITRGWASVDVLFRGQSFRFITTHLEDGESGPPLSIIQQLQAGELLEGPANTPLPVVMAADFNATANNPADPSYGAYLEIVAAGLVDEWPVANPSDTGFTCCQAPLLDNTVSSLSDRIDLVFGSSPFVVRGAALVGATSSEIAPNIFWASDHAGVFAKLKLPD